MQLVYVTFKGNAKEYAFLDTKGLVQSLGLREGTIFGDERYDSKLTVARITSADNVVKKGVAYYLGGIPLKNLSVDYIESKRVDQPIAQSERALKVSIEQAREWYKSGNSALRALALSAFTENEILDIPDSVEEICKRLNISWNVKWAGFSPSEVKAFTRQMAETAVARYLNKGWTKSVYEDGFFIGYVGASSPAQIVAHIDGNLAILSHHTVKYPGLVYYKTPEIAAKAFKLLKDYYK